ncbi:AAA family ATPase [Nisaea sediminum]|uniref:AAA family ATPase n=1 Tax=Nisaea sediminum TaxID=2775867 RepID=UPI00186795E5|nr:AAA family ATPase [Nisaea sediminum]
MQFLVYRNRRTPPDDESLNFPYVSLYQDNWDDFGWKCRFVATLHISDDDEIFLGPLRISDGGESFRVKETPKVLSRLPSARASLGESIAYYRYIGNLNARLRRKYLNAVGDVVAKPDRANQIESEGLWEKCFMREASSRHALKRGGYYIGAKYEEVEPPSFAFEMRLDGATGPHLTEFDFTQINGLSNRMILLIGRNGTGKTQTLSALAAGLMPAKVFDPNTLSIVPETTITPDLEISRVIAISYNIFDEFPLPRSPGGRAPRMDGSAYRSRGSYKYCGLRTADGNINANEINQMMEESLEPVVDSDRLDVLRKVLSTLLSPDEALALTSEDDGNRSDAIRLLSAGQRLVVALFSNIIGFIEEGSLLLIDEPETNLHPGLLSSFVSALHETLEEFDSYAVVASHSPILLQQVPSNYVKHYMRDNTDTPRIRKLNFESFGEDLGELSRKVLGLADPERDFTDVLKNLYKKHGSAEAVAELFQFQLGVPAMAHLYCLEEDEYEGGNST